MSSTLILAWNPWAWAVIAVVFLVICGVMVLTVLIQKPQGGGLANAFGGGGAGSGQTAFGAKTGDALTVFTIVVFTIYILLAVTLNYASKGYIESRGAPPPEPVASPDGTTGVTTPGDPVPAETETTPAEEVIPSGMTPGAAEPVSVPPAPSGEPAPSQPVSPPAPSNPR